MLTQTHNRRRLVTLITLLSPAAVAAVLLVAGFALASRGTDEAHAIVPQPLPCSAYGAAGQDISTGVQGVGNRDLIWKLTSEPSPLPPTGPAYGVAGDYVSSLPWISPSSSSNANWIDPSNTSSNASDPTGTYVYDGGFYAAPGTIELNIDYAAADSVAFILSDPSNTTLATFGASSPGSFTGLNHVSQTVVAGSAGYYHLQATVTNPSGPTGLLVQGAVICTLAPCTGLPANVSTGQGPSGVSDGRWFLTGGPTGSGVGYPVAADSAWAQPSTGTKWIDTNNTSGMTADPSGTYVYETTFFESAASTFTLTVDYAGAASIVLTVIDPSNAVIFTSPAGSVGPTTHATYTQPAPSSANGSYILRASVTNAPGGPSAFLVEGTVTCATQFLWGDNDCSGTVTGVDALWVLLTAANLTPAAPSGCPTMTQTVNIVGYPADDWGDVDCDPIGYLPDVIRTLQFVAGNVILPIASCPNMGQSVILY